MTQAVAANDDGEFGPDYTVYCLISAMQDVVDDPEAMSILVDCQSATEAFLRFTEKMCAVIAAKHSYHAKNNNGGCHENRSSF